MTVLALHVAIRDNVTVQGKIKCKENGYMSVYHNVRLEKYNT